MIDSLILFISLAQFSATLVDQWRQIAMAAPGHVGVAASLVEFGDTQEINGDTHFPMQSVYKFPIALAVLADVDRGTLRLDQKIPVLRSDLVPTGVHSPLRDQHPLGNIRVTLRDVLRRAVSESDGTASDVLLRVAGGPQPVTEYLQHLGVKDVIIATSEKEMARSSEVQYQNGATPNAMVQLLQLFLKARLFRLPAALFCCNG